MAINISDLKIEPFPLKRRYWGRGECKITSDEGKYSGSIRYRPNGE